MSPARLGAIDFLSPQIGVALSASSIFCVSSGSGVYEQDQPVLVATTADGGTEWVTQGSSLPPNVTTTFATQQVVAVSTTTLWALDGAGTLYATADGGATWTAQSLPSPVVHIIPDGGWLWMLACPTSGASALCTPVVERVPLAGGDWQNLPLPPGLSGSALSLNIVSPDVAVLVFEPGGDAEDLVVTTDDGARWSVQRTPEGPGNLCMSFGWLAAASSTDWWLLCTGSVAAGSSTKALMQTVDGGQTWHTVATVPSLQTPPPLGSLTEGEVAALAAGSSAELWLAGFNEFTESDDGGVTWTTVSGVDLEGAPGTFDVLSPRLAWYLAPGTGLWATSDGATWHALGAVATY